ncbi:transposase family Tnp2 protein [Rhizoctonia solani AG-3 Rhs1AP]|uniref:Transposase family Tnp2 protein n=1 Tax=Rhizoctonia solani AG-3 Rhs1AP TaxID=1086054 RepID=X8JGS1_9AGAM|nr:transposase family Tnp2 protein [Rhizoctonia solani AG-3 Rhs1AP]
MERANMKLPRRRSSAPRWLQRARESFRRLTSRESVQAQASYFNSMEPVAGADLEEQVNHPDTSHSSIDPDLDMEDDPPTEPEELEILPTEPSIWDEVFRNRQYTDQPPNEASQRDSRTTSQTQSAPDNPEELDNISLISVSDHFKNLDPTTHGLSVETILDADELVEQVLNDHTLLEEDDIKDLWSFDLFVRHRPTEALWDACMERYQPIGSSEDARLPSIKELRSKARLWSGYLPMKFDCCINSCVLFTGYLNEAETCPVCHSARFTWSGVGVNTFTYLPLIPQLRALFACPEMAEKMRYRHNYVNLNGTMADIFDSAHYKKLRRTKVVIEGQQQPYLFFEEEHEIALGLAADGMCPFKRRKNSCWPLMLVNYNLPPDERIHIDNLICIGVVPGPKCPADLNSFLQPLVNELLELSRGTAAVDATQEKLFALRAHLITVFGDIPAITKILEFVGHNGCFPCRFCSIPTVSGPTSGGGFHRYCPLHQPNGFQTDPLNLPMRTAKETLRFGLEVLRAPTESARSARATETGVKGVTILAQLPSIVVPHSFPVDLMHMIWQNLIPQLLDLWTGNFNNLDSGLEDYMIGSTVLDAINSALKSSRKTMPTQYGCAVPELSKRSEFIAETWDVFTTLYAPSVLRRSFKNQRYYVHFVRLVKLLRTLISYDLPHNELPALRQGIAEWIQEYEQIYYQFDEERLQTCPVNLHYLLHVVDSIEFLGPIWCYWTYPMERFCSYIGSSVKSRRYPYANIDQRVLNRARLQIILWRYRLYGQAPFVPRKRGKVEVPMRIGSKEYKDILLLTPHSKMLKVSRTLRRHIIRYLTTSFGVNSHDIEDLIPEELEQWGRFRIDHGGDEFQARGYHKLRPDGRDASFVRYELMVDQNADQPDASEDYERESQYGQLEFVFVLPIKPKTPQSQPQQNENSCSSLSSHTGDPSSKRRYTGFQGSVVRTKIRDRRGCRCSDHSMCSWTNSGGPTVVDC